MQLLQYQSTVRVQIYVTDIQNVHEFLKQKFPNAKHQNTISELLELQFLSQLEQTYESQESNELSKFLEKTFRNILNRLLKELEEKEIDIKQLQFQRKTDVYTLLFQYFLKFVQDYHVQLIQDNISKQKRTLENIVNSILEAFIQELYVNKNVLLMLTREDKLPLLKSILLKCDDIFGLEQEMDNIMMLLSSVQIIEEAKAYPINLNISDEQKVLIVKFKDRGLKKKNYELICTIPASDFIFTILNFLEQRKRYGIQITFLELLYDLDEQVQIQKIVDMVQSDINNKR